MAYPVQPPDNNPSEEPPPEPDVEYPKTPEDVRAYLLSKYGSATRVDIAQRFDIPEKQKVVPPQPFLQRFTYEERINTVVGQIDSTFLNWAWLGFIDPIRRRWLREAIDWLMTQIGGLVLDLADPVKTSIRAKWADVEYLYPDDERLKAKYEFIIAHATALNLTISRKRAAFKAYPRDKMAGLFHVDAKWRIEDPESIGVAQLATMFADRVSKQKDTFVIVDIWTFAPEQFGGGKTQVMLQLLAATAKILRVGFDFRWEVVYADDHARLRRFLSDRTMNACRGIDELDQFAYKRRSQYGEQKATIDVWKRNRKWGQLWIGCTPSLWELDEFLRDIKVTHRVRIREWDDEARRGKAEVFAKGGDKEEKEDRWGHGLMDIEYMSIPSHQYVAYKKLVAYVEDWQKDARKSALDVHLKSHPAWLADEINRDQVTDLDVTNATTSPESLKSDAGVSIEQ